jgi:HSP20 family protein
MSSPNPTTWMWAQACELLDQAERMHRQFFHLAVPGRTHAVWEPPVDVFEDEFEIVVVVALPGVPSGRVEIAYEPGALVVRAERRVLFTAQRRTVRRLEIPYGYFERRIELPESLLDAATHEYMDGCLIVRLRKTGPL